MYPRRPLDAGLSEGIDEDEIKKAALLGLQKANEEFGTNFYFKSIGYIPNDSRHYDIHARIVWEVIRHLQNGGEFRELER